MELTGRDEGQLNSHTKGKSTANLEPAVPSTEMTYPEGGAEDQLSKVDETKKKSTLEDDKKGKEMFSRHSGVTRGSPDTIGTRRSTVLQKRLDSRVFTDLTFDIVVKEESDPSFVADLHDLTKTKVDARDFLVKEGNADTCQQEQTPVDSKKDIKQTSPWRQVKPTPKAKLEESLNDLNIPSVKIGGKIWVPTVINPLELDIRKSQQKELKEVYEMLESSREGKVSVDELLAMVTACGSQPSSTLVDDAINKIELAHPGFLSNEEFEDFMRYQLQEKDPIEEIRRAFQNMSRNKKDRVGMEDLREVSKLVDYPLTDEELMEMINAACPSGSGATKEATLGGFVRLMTESNWYDNAKKPKRKKNKLSMKRDRVYRRFNQPLT